MSQLRCRSRGSSTEHRAAQVSAHLHRQHAGGACIEPSDAGGGVQGGGLVTVALTAGTTGSSVAGRQACGSSDRVNVVTVTGSACSRLAAPKPAPAATKTTALQNAALQAAAHSKEQSTLLHSQPAEGSQMSSSSGSRGCGGEGSSQRWARSSRRAPLPWSSVCSS